jgi:hypothetical protein
MGMKKLKNPETVANEMGEALAQDWMKRTKNCS